MASGGSKGVVMVHLIRFAMRMALLLVVGVIVGGVYLFKLPETVAFKRKIEAAIGEGLGGSDSELSGFKRVQGAMQIAKFVSEGSSKTFFSTLEARDIKCQMGIFDSLPGKWRLGVLAIGSLDVHLNAGADDAESAQGIANSLFRKFDNLEFDTIDVREGTVRWGFSERTRGIISGSHLKIQRVADGWRIHASGGQFTQNWLKRMDIVELSARCTRAGIVFEKAEFSKGLGRLRMDGLQLKAGERPVVKGVAVLSQMPIEGLIPPAAQEFVDGAITGDFQVSGSTNTEAGLALEGQVTVDENSPLKLRDRIYLLRALTEFAVYSNFRTVNFTTGSLKIKTQAGGMELEEVDLKAPQKGGDDLLSLVGQMRVRFPTPEEAAAAVERNRTGAPVPGLGIGRDPADALGAGDDPNFNLRKFKKVKERAETSEVSTLFDRIGQGFEARRKAEQAVERESRTLIYDGGFQITLLADTFETMPALRELFPVDSQSGRIPMDVPIKGDLYSITFDQTEDLYVRAKR